jgi:hypothetical protein
MLTAPRAKILIPLPDKITQQHIVEEISNRTDEVTKLTIHAETIWQQARACFEEQLLHGVQS